MSETGIIRCLARVGSTGWMGIFGSIHPISLRPGESIAVATELGEFAAEVAANLTRSQDNSDSGTSFYAGEILRLLTDAEKETQHQNALWCTEHLNELETTVSHVTQTLSIIDCEKSLCGEHLIVWFLGQGAAELGPLSVALAERWQLATVRFLSPENVRSLTEKKDARLPSQSSCDWHDVASEKENSEKRFSKDAASLLQEHGIYQQKLRRTSSLHSHPWPQPTMAMVRIRKSGPFWTSLQMAKLLKWSKRYGDGWLRPTTRQGWQIYGISKSQITPLSKEINSLLLTTQGTCGNHPRNITCCPLAQQGDQLEQYASTLAIELDRLLVPKCPSYELIWLDDSTPDSLTGIESSTLPHKLKVGVSTATHVCTEVLSNDVAIVLSISELDSSKTLADIYLGGSLAFRRDQPGTFAQLARYACTIGAEDILPFVRGLVQAFQTWGPRRQRRLSRLKYWLNEIGMEELLRLTRDEAPRPLSLQTVPEQRARCGEASHYGLHIHHGRSFIGLRWKAWGLNGGDDHLLAALNSAEFAWLKRWYLTTQQEILFGCTLSEPPAEICSQIQHSGLMKYFADLPPAATSIVREGNQRCASQVMSCAALPTCSLALSDAEAHKEELAVWLAEFSSTTNMQDKIVDCRISGCANNCSRPLLADIGLIAHGPNRYGVYLGGSHANQQLAQYSGLEFAWGDELKAHLRQLICQESGARFQGPGLKSES